MICIRVRECNCLLEYISKMNQLEEVTSSSGNHRESRVSSRTSSVLSTASESRKGSIGSLINSIITTARRNSTDSTINTVIVPQKSKKLPPSDSILKSSRISQTFDDVHAGTAIWVAFIVGLLFSILKPILVILTLPATILTLGLFLFVINAAMILLANSWIDGFSVSGFWTALLFSILLSFVESILHKLIETDWYDSRSSHWSQILT